MDALSVVSSASVNRSLDFHHKASTCSSGGGRKGSGMVQKKWATREGRRQSYDISQRSEVSAGTDLSAERPNTRDTSLLMRDASILSGQPDKSNFREKMQSWAVYEDSSSPYLAPRPTTSLAEQKPSSSLNLMNDIEREMTFLMSRPSTTFPSKPKELVEPLEGILPDERPVSQKKFLVLPSIGHRHPGDIFLHRQRSNLETVNQLDFSRTDLEYDVTFFSEYYQQNQRSPNHRRQKLRKNNEQQKQQPPHQQQFISDDEESDLEEQVHYDPPHFVRNPRESPTKSGKIGTPMPLPPIHKLKWDRLRGHHGLTELEEENAFLIYSRGDSRISKGCSTEDEDDPEEFRLKTPETFRSDSPIKTATITPPPGFR